MSGQVIHKINTKLSQMKTNNYFSNLHQFSVTGPSKGWDNILLFRNYQLNYCKLAESLEYFKDENDFFPSYLFLFLISLPSLLSVLDYWLTESAIALIAN